jgi:hypothetical protein
MKMLPEAPEGLIHVIFPGRLVLDKAVTTMSEIQVSDDRSVLAFYGPEPPGNADEYFFRSVSQWCTFLGVSFS